MRLVILTQYYPPEIGAAQIRLSNMSAQLLQHGHQVEIVTAMPNYPNGQILPAYRRRFYLQENIDGIKVHRVWIYAATGSGWKRLLNYLSFMLTSFNGLRRVEKPDFLFVESPPLFLGISGYLMCWWWRVPFIFNVSDLWPDSIQALDIKQPKFIIRILYKLEAFLYRKATYVNTLAKGICEILHQEKAVPMTKILYLPNGIDTKVFYPSEPDTKWQQNLQLPLDKQIILYAGTHGYAHGLEIILHTAQLLINEKILFLCVGGGSEKQNLQQQALKLQLHNIKFLPPQLPTTINKLYALSLAGLSTFRRSLPLTNLGGGGDLLEQTLPAKILPIMACGKPVLYSGGGEGAALIAQAQAGIITPAGDANALAQAITTILKQPELAQKLGQNGHNYILQHLTWEHVVQAWLQQIES